MITPLFISRRHFISFISPAFTLPLRHWFSLLLFSFIIFAIHYWDIDTYCHCFLRHFRLWHWLFSPIYCHWLLIISHFQFHMPLRHFIIIIFSRRFCRLPHYWCHCWLPLLLIRFCPLLPLAPLFSLLITPLIISTFYRLFTLLIFRLPLRHYYYAVIDTPLLFHYWFHYWRIFDYWLIIIFISLRHFDYFID